MVTRRVIRTELSLPFAIASSQPADCQSGLARAWELAKTVSPRAERGQTRFLCGAQISLRNLSALRSTMEW